MLYPIKFKPIFKDKIWGGNKIKTILGKDFGKMPNCGESWEISGIQENISKVSNGFLKGNSLEELIEIYMGDLIGDKVFLKFGIEFPLLLKFIDATDVLSIQVHPNDDMALKRHNAYGKTEMWYVVQADENSEMIVGFNQKTNEKTYQTYLENGNIKEILNPEKVSEGDVFFLPAGRVHAIGAGILLAEIQQTSDITYRIYDWDRLDDQGNPRELHTDLALEAIDYNVYENYKTQYSSSLNTLNRIVSCRYFTCNIIPFNSAIARDYTDLDSFVIYMCLEGDFNIIYEKNETINIKKGETVLIPAILKDIEIKPNLESKILEIYIE